PRQTRSWRTMMNSTHFPRTMARMPVFHARQPMSIQTRKLAVRMYLTPSQRSQPRRHAMME
ncbi:unnamed protein product, partial [Symbiodinium sp. CCMP2592]